MESLTSNYSCFNVPSEPGEDFGFWCDDNNNGGIVNCARGWVAEWEMFTVIEDPDHKDTYLIRSNRTGKFMAVDPLTKKFKCTETRAVVEARFKMKSTEIGTSIYSTHYKMYINIDKNSAKGDLILNSTEPVYFKQFSVRKVAIANSTFSLYAIPENGKILMKSSNPYKFYLLQSKINEDDFYLETSKYEFVYPQNSTDPVTYSQTELNEDAYKYELKKHGDSDLLKVIKSSALDTYLIHDAGISDDAVFCNSDDPDQDNCVFNIKPM